MSLQTHYKRKIDISWLSDTPTKLNFLSKIYAS